MDAKPRKNQMSKLIDLTRKRFGKWTVVSQIGKKSKCKCDCGKVAMVWTFNLKNGRSKNCGCEHGSCKRYNIHGQMLTVDEIKNICKVSYDVIRTRIKRKRDLFGKDRYINK